MAEVENKVVEEVSEKPKKAAPKNTIQNIDKNLARVLEIVLI